MTLPNNLSDGLYALMDTSKGEILIQLEYQKTPMTVCNFVGLAEGNISNDAKNAGEPYYDNLIFHRVIEDFMVQGGDPEGSGRGGPGYRFPDEFDESLKHDQPGIFSMANAGPGTNGSQFFITHVATPWLDKKHTVFGKTIEGQEVIDAIAQGDTLNKVTIIRQGSEAEAFICNDDTFKSLKDGIGDRKAQAEEEAHKAILDEIEKRYPNAQSTPSGLLYVVHQEGEGDKPQKLANIQAHYTGFLMDGTKFDSSVDRGQAFKFSVGAGQVIAGWDEAFLDMKKGEKRTIILPPDLGYGARGAGGVIPPNAFLIFDVELIDF